MSGRARSILILVAAGLAAGGAPLAAQSGRITYDTFALANGLRVIYSEDHSTPIVSVDVWYNTGSRNERGCGFQGCGGHGDSLRPGTWRPQR